MDYALVSVAQSKLLIYLVPPENCHAIEPISCNISAEVRLLSSFSQHCATGEYGCPRAILFCKSIQSGRRDDAGWYTTVLFFLVPWLG